MFKFGKFPIYILYSLHRQETVQPLWGDYYSRLSLAKDRVKENASRLKIRQLLRDIENTKKYERLIEAVQEWEIIEDLQAKYKGEILSFESEIRQILTNISKTKIGQIVMSSLNQNEIIWIVPFYGVKGTAKTNRSTTNEGGGIRIRYNPGDFKHTYEGEKYKDIDARAEVLIHEMVHAARQSHNRFYGMRLDPKTFGNAEEFIAEQIGNMYRSVTRKANYYGLYDGGYDTKENIYQMFSQDKGIVNALKYFLQTEPIAQQAASLKSPFYNPFRDFDLIERESHKHFIDL